MSSKIVFCAGTKVFEEALNAVKFLGWLKKFGPVQNILEPVKEQGINNVKLTVKILSIYAAQQTKKIAYNLSPNKFQENSHLLFYSGQHLHSGL